MLTSVDQVVKYSIRLSKEEDIQNIILLDQSDNVDPLGESLIRESLQPKSPRQQENQFSLSRLCWVIEESNSNSLCGFLIATQQADVSELELLLVAHNSRRKGLASQLILTWYSYLQEHSITLAMLEVRESNQYAIELYKKFGFVSVGRRKNYYPALSSMKEKVREDAILMNLYSEKMLNHIHFSKE